MKLKPECIPCILDVRQRELEMLGLNEEEATKIMVDLTKCMSELLKVDISVTRLATMIYRKLKELTIDDPYLYVRERALAKFSEIKVLCFNIIKDLDGYRRFKEAVKLSLVGNSFDYGVAEFRPPTFESIDNLIALMSISKDHTLQLYEAVKAAKVVYLLDNVEELPFDYVMLSELKRLNCHVITIAKSGTFQNDTTIDDAVYVGLHQVADKLIGSGTDGSSVFLDEVSEDVRRLLEESNVIIAKGMAHYEYLSEIPLRAKTFFLLRAKCRAIAKELGVQLGDYVVIRGT